MPRVARPRVVFFDWHGTLVDTFDAMYRAVDDVLPLLGRLGIAWRLLPRGRSPFLEQAGVTAVYYNGAKWEPGHLVRIFPGTQRPDAIAADFAALQALALSCRAPAL